jgi:hypothetical protein
MPKNPFDMDYVLKITSDHMRKSIDISIKKTFARFPEFLSNPEKSIELFNTLSVLHRMRKNIDAFQVTNIRDFKGPVTEECQNG